MNRVININNKADLGFLNFQNFLKSRKWDNLFLDIGGPINNQIRQFELRLNKYFFACGCKTGTAFVIITIPIYIIYLFLRIEEINDLVWADLGGVFLVIILSALIGKMAGLFSAYLLLRKTINEILFFSE